MKKSTASGPYVSSQSRAGVLVGLNFFALHIWHQCAESKGIFNTQKGSAWAKCLPHKMTLILGIVLVNFQACFIFIILTISQTVAFILNFYKEQNNFRYFRRNKEQQKHNYIVSGNNGVFLKSYFFKKT